MSSSTFLPQRAGFLCKNCLSPAQYRREGHDGYCQNSQATLADLPLLLHYRHTMAEEMDGADEAAVNRMLAALEPYLRAAIPEDRWHSWIAEPGGCGSIEIVQWVPGRLDPTPRRAWLHSLYVEPSFRRRGIGRQLTQTIMAWCRERGFDWIYLHASDQGRPLYESLGFVASSEMRLKL